MQTADSTKPRAQPHDVNPASHHRRHRSELERETQQLAQAAAAGTGEAAVAAERCAEAEAARSNAEAQWREAREELLRTEQALEAAKWVLRG